MKIKRALLSVYDKTGIIDFAKSLSNLGVEIIATGGTYKILKENKVMVKEVSEITNFPEILDGRVKTLHPAIHGGILAKRTKKHLAELKKYKIDTVDIVVVNLYPFERVISQENAGRNENEVVENIDIGGVTLLRAAAKNYENVIVICEPSDYSEIIEKIKTDRVDLTLRKSLATKAFAHTSYYDSIIANYFNEEPFPSQKVIGLKLVSKLRYGENPHQKAAIYKRSMIDKAESMRQLQGKELSYNNYLDLDSAYSLVCEFKKPACVIVKHNNPCGVAISGDLLDAYKKAYLCDTVSAFGGVVAFNKNVDKKTAQEVIKIFTECIIAPSYDKDALKVFTQKKDLRVIAQPAVRFLENSFDIRKIYTGFLVQESDIKNFEKLEVVTKKKPTNAELESLRFAFTVSKYVKSNAIVLAFGTQTIGIGAGQMSRIDALKIAISKMTTALLNMKLSKNPAVVLASDAFFPFDDVVREAAKAGVKAIIQPGGSINDRVSIEACDQLGLSMVFTGIRHFRH